MPGSPRLDEGRLLDAVAAELVPARLPAARRAALGARLQDRIRRSVEAHHGLATVRREDGLWLAAASGGVRRRVLRRGDGVRIELFELDRGACLPWLGDTSARELLIVRGEVAVERPGAASIRLPAHAHRVVARSDAERCRAAVAGTLVYVRHRLLASGALPAIEARWWGSDAEPAGGSEPWQPFCEGVDAIALRSAGQVVSMLVRVAAGASLPDHGHALDEDCMMLEGELFLGDILMRAGDYQRAEVGAQHVGSASDSGALFYFHGALPAPASEAIA